jgi:uncharacterized protein
MHAPVRRAQWREPMLWLVAGLPLLVLAAAAATVALARRTPADASAAQVRRIAQVQLEDLAPDRAAAQRGLQATLEADPAAGTVTLRAGSAALPEQGLELHMLHPLSQAQDRIVLLTRTAGAWRGRTAAWTPHAWELRLQPPHGAWRLTGRLAREAVQARMQPAVAP